MKKCKKCGLEVSGRDCKPCKAAYMREWNAKNPEKVKRIRKQKYERTKVQDNLRSKNWAKNNREKSNSIKQAYKQRNREKYLAQQREYAKQRYIQNREVLLSKEQTPESKASYAEWREKNRLRLNAEYLQRYHSDSEMKKKHSARDKVRKAVLSGKLIKPEACSACDDRVKLQAHHEDYDNPLEVVWLCKKCHWKLHTKYSKVEMVN